MASKKDKPGTGVSKKTFYLVVAIAAIIAFVAGTRSNELLGSIAPLFGVKVETGSLDLASLQQTYRDLKANYDGEVSGEALIEGANKGLVDALGDPYTVYLDPEEAKKFEESLTGDIGGGIGAEIGLRNDRPTIVRLLPGNPAAGSGLEAGDVILAVNDEAVGGWTLEEVVERIRGEIGTTVKLTVVRNDEAKDFTVTRATVNNPSVQSKMEDGIGILTISRFDNETANLTRKAAQKFKEDGAKSVILDLRDNGGGYLAAAQDVAGIWLNDKVVVSERTDGKEVGVLRSGSSPVLDGIPLVVLVNGSSASASEIVAGALKDHGVATLIGEKTFGKGTVQKVVELSGGAQLKVTVARWFTPNGQNISEAGIAPDKEVKMTVDDLDAGRDPQLKAAENALK